MEILNQIGFLLDGKMCMDYRKLNLFTQNDHFALSFLDEGFKRLAGQMSHYFIDR